MSKQRDSTIKVFQHLLSLNQFHFCFCMNSLCDMQLLVRYMSILLVLSEVVSLYYVQFLNDVVRMLLFMSCVPGICDSLQKLNMHHMHHMHHVHMATSRVLSICNIPVHMHMVISRVLTICILCIWCICHILYSKALISIPRTQDKLFSELKSDAPNLKID